MTRTVTGGSIRNPRGRYRNKMAGLFILILTLVSLTPCYLGRDSQQYSEQLFMKQLSDGRVSATFQFSTVWGVHPFALSRQENGELWRYTCTCHLCGYLYIYLHVLICITLMRLVDGG